MSRRDRQHGRARSHGRGGALSRWLPVALVLVLLGGAVAAHRFDLGARWFGTGDPDPRREPAAVPPPEGLQVPTLSRPATLADGADDGPLSPSAVRRALARGLRDRDLGRSVHAGVAPLGGGPAVFASGEDPFMPASTTKVVTATAALAEASVPTTASPPRSSAAAAA